MLMSATLLFNCSPSGDSKAEKTQEEIERDIKNEKQEIAKDLRSLRDDINTKLDKISKKT
jgi:F0F1-type ATP synthase membrane subunit b/b'